MLRFFALGFLIGVILAVIITFLFPIILEQELLFKITQFKNTNYLYVGGLRTSSIFAVGSLLPMYSGILCGLIGLIIFKIKAIFKF